jgi:energy-coupling factor transporter transmembrane protein EcfT
MSGAANAAIVTLAFTLGTWILEFVAAGRGGLIQQLASFTPTAALRIFEQGQLRISILIVTCIFALAGFALAAVWMKWSWRPHQQWMASIALVVVFGSMAWAGSAARSAWDLSEDRRNSFSPQDEVALNRIRKTLRITVHLAAEDPRLMDLERNILSKLRRILPQVTVEYASEGRSGLFESAGANYGEIWYEIGGRRVMSRSTTEQIVLETIYQLASIAAPANREESQFAGHPLAVQPRWAAAIFYGFWPALIMLGWWFGLRGN